MVLRDRVSGLSRGVALLEFHSPEHAGHALRSAEGARLSDVSGTPFRLCFARPAFVTAQLTLVIPLSLFCCSYFLLVYLYLFCSSMNISNR